MVPFNFVIGLSSLYNLAIRKAIVGLEAFRVQGDLLVDLLAIDAEGEVLALLIFIKSEVKLQLAEVSNSQLEI